MSLFSLIFLFIPFRRFLFIFLMRSLSSIAPSSYGLFRPKPGERASRRDVERSVERVAYQSLTTKAVYMNIHKVF